MKIKTSEIKIRKGTLMTPRTHRVRKGKGSFTRHAKHREQY